MKRPWRWSAEEAARARIPPGGRSAEILRHGSLEVRWYAPQGEDPQTPHERDELYVVARGSGVFVRGAERVPFGPGDVLFVPARLEHRFEHFTDGFAAWVVFWGPEGGERDNPFV